MKKNVKLFKRFRTNKYRKREINSLIHTFLYTEINSANHANQFQIAAIY